MTSLIKQAIIRKILSAMDPRVNFKNAKRHLGDFHPRAGLSRMYKKQATDLAKHRDTTLKSIDLAPKLFKKDMKEGLKDYLDLTGKKVSEHYGSAVKFAYKRSPGGFTPTRDVAKHNAKRAAYSKSEKIKGILKSTALAGGAAGLGAGAYKLLKSKPTNKVEDK